MINNFINDLLFAANVALLCSTLNNIDIRAQCPFYDSWLAPEAAAVPHGVAAGAEGTANRGEAPGVLVRLTLAQYLHANASLP